jgi:hydrogenase maturation protein HypF
MKRMRVALRGAVQGVGFRPFVYRLARSLGLAGWVSNSNAGVLIDVEGEEGELEQLLLRLTHDRPPLSFIQSMEHTVLDPLGMKGFVIRESDVSGTPTALVLPDIATCPECVAELFDPLNRRYRYPFINCTHCGPRFSIVTALPYDRPNTSMAGFDLCPACRAEYEDPEDRRFHAQPIACPSCGPRLTLLAPDGRRAAEREGALLQAAGLLRTGGILALKGIGGFQLLTDARNAGAVNELRRRKRREEKPFAVMMPSLADVHVECTVSPLEERLLLSAEAPIVLLDRRSPPGIVGAAVAPGNPTVGVMLPYSPLHHLLMRECGFPVVATSGNLSDEPMCTGEDEALERLHGIADLFLVHDRPIVRHVDDSIARAMAGREMILRRARGYAPLPLSLHLPAERTVLAAGAHLKNTVGLLVGGNAFLSQHIGDLSTAPAHAAFHAAAADLQNLYGRGEEVLCDLHPDYVSSAFARSSGLPLTPVQHHHAHVLACMMENELEGPVLGISWDGTGMGTDGTVWGGEFLVATGAEFQRTATFRSFRLPGGETAIREPRRAALGIMYEMRGEEAFDVPPVSTEGGFPEEDLRILKTMLRSGLNSPLTSSVGRLFDAAASLLGMRHTSSYEGQAAMELEAEAARSRCVEEIDLPIHKVTSPRFDAENQVHQIQLETVLTIDWAPLFDRMLASMADGSRRSDIALLFHSSLAACVVAVAREVGLDRVVLSGGCFQNRLLTELTIKGLQKNGNRVYWHQRVPPNDGGIALGQLYAAAMRGRPAESIGTEAQGRVRGST